jgi:hypothetical protein
MMMSWLAEHEGAVGGERELRAAGGAGGGAGAHHQLVHIGLSNASESGGQSLSRAMRVFSAYSAYIGLELERFCTDGRRSRRGHEEGEEKPSGTHLSASDVDGGHVARSR